MKDKNREAKERLLLKHFGNMHKMIANNHELDNLAEFVLHDLCSEKGFNVVKAAYFINNPDFHFLRGVAGFTSGDAYSHDHWGNCKDFSDHMKKSEFNNLVRKCSYGHFESNKDSENERIQQVTQDLHLVNPQYHTWGMKNDNHGLFIYETQDKSEINDHLHDYVHVLGQCPIY